MQRLLSLFPFPLLALNQSTPLCRCLYGDACWPTTSDFSSLQSQISRPLIYPIPTASACYPLSSPSENCTDIQTNWHNGTWRAGHPGSMDSTNYESFISRNGSISACYVNTTLGVPCEQGNVPVIGVDARSVSDVQAAVKFAASHNLRVAIKNTGHDFTGRSAARNSFMIWTHHLNNITLNPTFVPEGAPAMETYDAITIGSGVIWNDAYNAVAAQGRMLIGGISAGGSVGAAGGWLQGGGHSAFSPLHGLGVDNVIEIKLVTAAGEYLTANAHQHSDLFWALRGGGGGTWGVLTSVTYQTHPTFPVTTVFFNATATNTTVIKKLFTEFVRIHPALSTASFGGYAIATSTSLNFLYSLPNGTDARANASFDSFFGLARSLAVEGLEIATQETGTYDSFNQWFQSIFQTIPTDGGIVELASRLLPTVLFAEDEYEAFADKLFTVAGYQIIWNFVAGGAVSKVDPDSTGLNPAWRESLVEAIWGVRWNEGATYSEIERMRAWLAATMEQVSAIMPGAGSYFNEVRHETGSLFEPTPKETYFGSHYDRLKEIKDEYDPNGLFIVGAGVGSDEWVDDLNCRRSD
ncbi:FAD-binding domain-containing protein [Leucogyrophana mollusca]|uniref:FAD-binding domain-containing protein n=1 Tax=Leucogyrophana mollusca TaxID=85980 RepID=A0ACB8B8J7_9AGAM|nr:FAD-binding domain-containing protein [Leucogyrophana mollusca]